MVQFYLLSVLCNFAAGYIFVFGSEPNNSVKNSSNLNERIEFTNKRYVLILGLLTVITGFCKLITPIYDNIIIIGDFIPAVAGIVSGFCLLLDYYNDSTTVPVSLPKKLDLIFTKSRRYVGIVVMIISIIHFLFPTMPLF
ncbi:MAG: hypothetical protein GX297_02630 [Treponema sp.]|nr:hypothetical protein [Treponema sp.]